MVFINMKYKNYNNKNFGIFRKELHLILGLILIYIFIKSPEYLNLRHTAIYVNMLG